VGKLLAFAVFDCNIFVQTLLNPNSNAAKCFDLVRKDRVLLFVSKDTLNEVRNVILRPNILARLPNATPAQIDAFIEEIIELTELVEDISAKFKFERDPKDEIIINLALACKPEYIVSRDRDLLDLMTDISVAEKEFRQKSRPLKIVEPEEFLRIIEEQGLSLMQ
jgi:putative PIN family toxin of toxin-antitoxin system